MSAPLDVLAILEREMRVVAATSGSHAAMDLQAARAAVAELHLAARDFKWVTENAYGIEQTAPAKARLEAALAKFGGAA